MEKYMAEVKALEKNPAWKGRRGPVVLVIWTVLVTENMKKGTQFVLLK